MNRNIAILFGVVVPASGPIADDITVDTTLVQFRRTRTPVQVLVQLTNARVQVAALNGEDSGSAYLSRHDKAATGPLLDYTERGLLKSHRYAVAPKQGEHGNWS